VHESFRWLKTLSYRKPPGCSRNSSRGAHITADLLRFGARRIAFVALPEAASTVAAREAGYCEAVYRWDMLTTILERVRRPSLPPREVLLDCELVVRASYGGAA
jgi:DNA-binding LacI/PurR family transcriptional regulator